MKLATHLGRLESKFPVSRKPELASCVHWGGVEHLPVHRWFRYREGYSPSLFSHFGGSRVRLDPFCGCGTTLLTSSAERVESFGLDLNPLATFVAKVKTRRYGRTESKRFASEVASSLRQWKRQKPVKTPPYPLLTKLFQPESLDALLRLRSFIESVSVTKVKNLLILAWLSIIEDSSNVFKEGNGLKYRNKRRRPGKYMTLPDEEWIPKYFGTNIEAFVLGLWKRKCDQIAQDLATMSRHDFLQPRVRTGSCFEADNLVFGKKADLVIFSPPYANRFDYFEAFKMELWLGRFVQSTEDMAALRAKSMRNNLSAPRDIAVSEWNVLAPFLDCMDKEASSVRMGIKHALSGYFDDMRILLKNLKHQLANSARVVVVVGNSAYAKSIIPTDLLISSIGVEEGYRVEALDVARALHVSSQQRSELHRLEKLMRESVIVLRN